MVDGLLIRALSFLRCWVMASQARRNSILEGLGLKGWVRFPGKRACSCQKAMSVELR